MLIHFSYKLSVIIIGNTSVNGYDNYSSAFTSTFIDLLIFPLLITPPCEPPLPPPLSPLAHQPPPPPLT